MENFVTMSENGCATFRIYHKLQYYNYQYLNAIRIRIIIYRMDHTSIYEAVGLSDSCLS